MNKIIWNTIQNYKYYRQTSNFHITSIYIYVSFVRDIQKNAVNRITDFSTKIILLWLSYTKNVTGDNNTIITLHTTQSLANWYNLKNKNILMKEIVMNLRFSVSPLLCIVLKSSNSFINNWMCKQKEQQLKIAGNTYYSKDNSSFKQIKKHKFLQFYW